MSGFEATDDRGRTITDLTPETLGPLLLRAQRVRLSHPAGADYAATAERVDARRWRVEVRQVGELLQTTAPNVDAAYDILRSWAAGDGWWQEAFSWQPLP